MKHEHKFVIPVEWTSAVTGRYSEHVKSSVSKLRCECGEEIDR